MIIRKSNQPIPPDPLVQMGIWQVTIKKGSELETYNLLALDYNDLHDQLGFTEEQSKQIACTEYVGDVTTAPNPTNKIISI